MAAIITSITFGVFCERVQKFLANNYADISNNVTNNEILTYFYGCSGVVIETDANQKYQIEGIYPDQEGFITTYSFPASSFVYNWDSGDYSLTLPFPILNLPLGISVKSPYFIGGGGKSMPLFAVHAYQKGYDRLMPSSDIGMTYEVEGQTMVMQSQDVDLINSGWTLKIPMLSTRSATGADTDVIYMPDAAIEQIFEMVVEKLVGRKQQPQNNVNAGVDRYSERP